MKKTKLKKLFWPWGYNKLLQARIDHITNITIYPAAVSGFKDPELNYEKRSEWQEGWNAAAIEVGKRIIPANTDVNSTTAIMSIVATIRICASVNSVCPCIKFRCFCQTVSSGSHAT